MGARKSCQGNHKGRCGVTCKKRLRDRGSGNDYRDPEVSIPDATRQRPKEKLKSRVKSLRYSQGGSEPVLCHRSRAIYDVRGTAIFTVESSGLRPVYYFTFVPDASPMLA
ncbi:hypothetical protein BDV33DRAFT_177937 [Aspergillus novoparasiticus]|uniref:Uncharacterized protein n=1 Tax=Aspergillus novoparasiticus TaxID=986946 RepID=A0A5N6EKS1_9EURO|nr:hypothetical protein BDV33DRAFT_177937 [Aspergillus novoparasiticus]